MANRIQKALDKVLQAHPGTDLAALAIQLSWDAEDGSEEALADLECLASGELVQMGGVL